MLFAFGKLARDDRQRLADGLLDPFAELRVGDHVVGEVRVVRVDANRKRQRLEEREQRPELVLENERVALASAGRGQQGRGVDEGVLVDEVEQVLEEAGERGAVDRARHDQHVGRLDRKERGLRILRKIGALEAPRQTTARAH